MKLYRLFHQAFYKKRMLLLFFNAVLYASGAAYASQTIYEALPVLDAADLLGKEFLQGPNYRINRKVINDGRMNSYQLTSDVQDIYAYGDLMAVERAYEIEAITVLRNIKQLDAYLKGLRNAASAPLAVTQSILEQPISTLQGMVGALDNYLNDIGAAIGSVGKVGSESRDRYSTIKGLIGFYKVKNELAVELGVDPFSSNTVLQKELNDVAWVMFAGGETIDAALYAAPMMSSVTFNLAGKIDRRQMDWRIPPPTLREAALRAVLNMGMSQEEAEKVVFHRICSLRHQMVMISALADLGDIKGRDLYLQIATTADDENECRHYQQLAELIWVGHQTFPILEMAFSGDQLWLEGTDGTRILPIRADYLIWSEVTEKLFMEFPKNGEVWVSGRVSEQTEHELRTRGVPIRKKLLLQRTDYVPVPGVLLPK